MEENQLAIPFELKYLRENVFKRILGKIFACIRSFARRAVDIILSLILCILLIPCSIVVKMIYVCNGDFKSIFTITECFGKKGKVIHVIKFRSINKDGTVNRLRLTAWDNLPKAINILFGSMSIVGPQPYLVSDREKMGTYFDRIIQMKPGITGIAQISYLEDYSFETRLDNDFKYYYRKNWFMDLKIVLITTLITIPRRNEGQILSYLNITIKDIGRCFMRLGNAFVKRTIDILGALVGIAFLIPLTLVVAIINLISGDRGPLFYSQERIGKDGKHFTMYKFRSMVIGADEKLKELLENDVQARMEYKKYKKLKNDPRITKAGNFLRRTSLDEFPQFINVLKGEMSLVGPRPYLIRETDEMNEFYDVIIKHKPGITGLWQVSGRSEVTFKERLDIDMKYHKEANCAQDIKILCQTVLNVLKHEGAA